MTDYSKGKVYKLVSDVTDEIYIGSTTQKSYKRLAGHKCTASRVPCCSSQSLFEKGNVKITLTEDYPCERKEQLHARERHWIETLPNINRTIPTRTAKENHSEKVVCDKCGLEMTKSSIRRHQGRSLCEAIAERRPTKRKQNECEKCGVEVINLNRHQETKKCQDASKEINKLIILIIYYFCFWISISTLML